jgi:Dullard-like phosphatase family protein
MILPKISAIKIKNPITKTHPTSIETHLCLLKILKHQVIFKKTHFFFNLKIGIYKRKSSKPLVEKFNSKDQIVADLDISIIKKQRIASPQNIHKNTNINKKAKKSQFDVSLNNREKHNYSNRFLSNQKKQTESKLPKQQKL